MSDVATEALAALFARAARRRGRVRLSYGGVDHVVDVLGFESGIVTAANMSGGVLRFRLERVTEALELPSSDPLF